jgi:glyoxylase I family protein
LFKRIDHVEIITGKLEETLNFYQNILGFKVKERIPMKMGAMQEILFLTLNDTMLEIISVSNPPPASTTPFQVGYVGMALEVGDMDKAVEYLKTKGIEMSRAPVSIGSSKRGEIKDPNGLTIELRQW